MAPSSALPSISVVVVNSHIKQDQKDKALQNLLEGGQPGRMMCEAVLLYNPHMPHGQSTAVLVPGGGLAALPFSRLSLDHSIFSLCTVLL